MTIVHCLPTQEREGYGVTTVVHALASSQRRRGHSVQVSCIVNPWTPGPSDKIDVIHQHMLWLRHGAMAQQLASHSHSPLLIAPHGALHPWARRKAVWKKRLAWLALEQQRLQRASCLHATSPFELTYFRDLGLRPPIALIPNGIDLGKHHLLSQHAGEDFRVNHPQLQGRRCLLFLSRITPQKGLLPLLDAFAAFSRTATGEDWHLLIAGSDQDDYLHRVRNAVEQLELTDRVLFLPPLYGVQKQQAMACSEAFVLPSIAEGFPMVVLEAMAAGLPVITTTASPWMELPQEDAGWWVEATAAGLALALADMGSRDIDELAAMGMRARRLIERSYDLEHVVSQLDALYSWLSGKGPQPACVHCGA